MSELIKEVEYKGCSIKIYQDEDAQSPDEWSNEDLFIVYDHRDFTIERKGFDPREIFENTQETQSMMFDGYHVFVLNAYIHSGVSLSLARDRYPFTDQWDVSTTGYVLVKKQKGWSLRRSKSYQIAQSLVDEWNQYLSGDIYGFQSEDEDGKDIDSCWGFYGHDFEKNGLLNDHARPSIDSYLKDRMAKRTEQVKRMIKNHVPLINRVNKLANL